ncbi:MAG: Rrf2 family transcriptional regulator [Alphaproteobacteria bacterium]|nr:Rrf2 family transcriptional regulator [Alphaproteobacteria bacterium]
MIRIGRKTLLAIEAVLDIALHAGSQPVQSAAITARLGIPRRYLEPMLQQLTRAEILSGVRGPRGGYRLARERRRISVGEIVRVASLVESGQEDEEELPGSALGHQVVRPFWQELQDAFIARLDAVTLDDLCTRARALGISGSGEARLDYAI